MLQHNLGCVISGVAIVVALCRRTQKCVGLKSQQDASQVPGHIGKSARQFSVFRTFKAVFLFGSGPDWARPKAGVEAGDCGLEPSQRHYRPNVNRESGAADGASRRCSWSLDRIPGTELKLDRYLVFFFLPATRVPQDHGVSLPGFVVRFVVSFLRTTSSMDPASVAGSVPKPDSTRRLIPMSRGISPVPAYNP